MAPGSNNSGKPPGGPPRPPAAAPPRAPGAPAPKPGSGSAPNIPAVKPPSIPAAGTGARPPSAPSVPAVKPPGVALPAARRPPAISIAPVAGPGAPKPGQPAVARPAAPPRAPPTIQAGAAVRPPTAPAPGIRPPTVSSVAVPAPPAPVEEDDLLVLDATVEPDPLPAPIPERGPVEVLTLQQSQALKALADAIDGLDYFQVLSVPDSAGMVEIKKAFYRWSRCYHPDRFFHLKGDEAKDSINALYKRITEAYYFLRDDAKRKKYLADLKGPDRAHKLRFTEASETEAKAEKKKEQEEQFGTTPKGREFFKQALAEIDKGNWSAAERNLKSAMMYESGNAKFKEKLEEVKQKAFEAARASGNTGFKIK